MKGRRWKVTPNGLKIGRAEGCEIQVGDVSAELYHCIVKLVDGKPLVQNLASDSGVDVNGTSIDEAELDPNDTIRIGNERFILVASGDRNPGLLVRNVSICAILLGLAVIGAHFYRQHNGSAVAPAPAPAAVQPSDDAATTNRVVKIVSEEIVTTNRVVHIVDNVIVTNYVVETRRVDAKTGAVTVEGGENVYEPPPPSDGLVLSQDGKTLVSVPKDLKHVVIPDGVTAIGDRAVADHKALGSVTIPPSVTKFGRDAFRGCDRLVGVFITDLAAWCQLSFEWDNKPWECANDNPLCFAHNLYLNGMLVKDLEIPQGVTIVGNNSFRGCRSLTSVKIPKDVRSIGTGAFAGCRNLAKMAVDGDNRHYKSIDGLLLTKDGRTLVAVPGGIERVKIPDGVVTIGGFAFLGCRKLSKVSIPDGVTSIGVKSFALCGGLARIEIPPSMAKIGHDAFGECRNLADVYVTDLSAWCRISYGWPDECNPLCYGGNLCLNGLPLKELKIPDDVTNIGHLAFRGCSSLTRVTISRNVQKIDGGAFGKCPNLVEFKVENGNRHYNSKNGLLVSKDGRTLVAVPGGLENVTIPDNVEDIGGGAFHGCCKLSAVAIPNGVKSIGGGAFVGCSRLSEVEIPDSVVSVGSYAFMDCRGLKIATVPKNVKAIPNGMFQNCTNLEKVTIQDGVQSIGVHAFAFIFGGRLKNVVIPVSVTNIAAGAFNCCTSLESVTVPAALTNIHERAFIGCPKLLDANGKPRLTRVFSDRKK